MSQGKFLSVTCKYSQEKVLNASKDLFHIAHCTCLLQWFHF